MWHLTTMYRCQMSGDMALPYVTRRHVSPHRWPSQLTCHGDQTVHVVTVGMFCLWLVDVYLRGTLKKCEVLSQSGYHGHVSRCDWQNDLNHFESGQSWLNMRPTLPLSTVAGTSPHVDLEIFRACHPRAVLQTFVQRENVHVDMVFHADYSGMLRFSKIEQKF